MAFPSAPAFPPPIFKDRKAGLVAFGILTVLMGVICALFVPLMILGQSMAAKSGVGQSTQTMVPALMTYGLLAVALVWLGIGSMKARRWARALLLIFSWSWLIIGVITVGALAAMFPQITSAAQTGAGPGQPEVSASASSAIMTITILMFSVIFIILPGLWVFFYGSKHVKATCEANDPIERWTDRCPLPVLAICIWLAFSVPTMLMMAIAYRGVVPVFGTFVAGPVGSALYVVFAAIWAYSAWALYKLDRRGWLIIVVFIVLFSISGFMTYSHHNVSELYALMGYPPEQIALMQKYSFLNGQAMAWLTLGCAIPFLGYLLYIRKFFPKLTE